MRTFRLGTFTRGLKGARGFQQNSVIEPEGLVKVTDGDVAYTVQW